MIVVKSIIRKMNTPPPPPWRYHHSKSWKFLTHEIKDVYNLNSEYTVVIFLDASLGMMDKIPHKYLEI